MNRIFEENQSRSNLAGRAVRSGLIFIVGRMMNGVLQFATTVVLARLLVPEDFGVVAIAAAVTSFGPSLIDFGLTDATVQRPKITPGEVSAMFWLSLGMSSLMALLLVLGSPFLASMYGQPSLAAITAMMGLDLVFYGLSLQHLALLRRGMRFNEIVMIEIGAYIVGAVVAICIAKNGGRYWALIARPLVTSFCMAVGAWICCDWRPGFPTFNAAVKSMVKFGMHVTGFSIRSAAAIGSPSRKGRTN
jgi:O-antigen/teichoic acid export membrane protein